MAPFLEVAKADTDKVAEELCELRVGDVVSLRLYNGTRGGKPAVVDPCRVKGIDDDFFRVVDANGVTFTCDRAEMELLDHEAVTA